MGALPERLERLCRGWTWGSTSGGGGVSGRDGPEGGVPTAEEVRGVGVVVPEENAESPALAGVDGGGLGPGGEVPNSISLVAADENGRAGVSVGER
jgi:hypothetical protein